MPADALTAIERGIEEKNIETYFFAFSPSASPTDAAFVARFDSLDLEAFRIQTGGMTPEPWDADDEWRAFPHIVGAIPVDYEVIFRAESSKPPRFVEADREVVLYRRYRVLAGEVLFALGAAEFRIRRAGADEEWKMVEWTDRRDTTASVVRTFGKRRLDARYEIERSPGVPLKPAESPTGYVSHLRIQL